MDYLNNIDQFDSISQMRLEANDLASKEWNALSFPNKLIQVFQQYATRVKMPFEYPHFEQSFILKTRRVEYVMEYFRGQIEPKSIRELADGNFVDEMRFQMTRIISISYICGVNAAMVAYFMAFRKLKVYVGIPLTLVMYF